MKKENLFPALFLVSAILWLGACARPNQLPPQIAPVLTETFSAGPIQLTMIAEPAQVHLDRDILLTLRVAAPSNLEVHLPPLEDRLQGFRLNGSFTRASADKAGQPVKEYCFRLTPTLAGEYRLAPLAIGWTNRLAGAGWFPTRAIVFPAAAINKGPDPATIQALLGPVWIYPPFKTLALGTLAALGAAGLIFLLGWLGKRLHKAIKLRRLSPKERALYELNELLAQDLPAKDKIKEFYLEITAIIRRYIERAHAIRAPEQTTEEFLAAAAQNTDFQPAVVLKLRAFLQTADLVKFAAYQPEKGVIGQSIATARDYLETDEICPPPAGLAGRRDPRSRGADAIN